ncbi:transglutaminase family protein [Phenylobacterium sp.]|jgi:transglutaminase-like putative cysteine protease|uniref:transglutaminase family protein n=1 Tax=Phenylobacterium sp. TaxID=1871053 RepID=UPI002F92C4DB
MPVVSIRHLTTYRYAKPVGFGEHRMMLRPLEGHDQRLISCEVEVSPEPSLLRQVSDVSGATVGVARFGGTAERLVFDSRAVVDHRPENLLDLADARVRLGAIPFEYDPVEAPELARSIARQHAPGEVDAWARRFVRADGSTRVSGLLADMTHAIREGFAYRLRLEGGPQAPAVTLESRTGSCRDFAVLMMDAARSLGLAARFVSGYVYSSSSKSGRKGGGHTHAWVRVYLPGAGWTDFDPTNGLIGGVDLIRVAAVADPRQALPLHGTWSGDASDFIGMDVEVDIRPEEESILQPASHLRVAQGR